MAAPIPTTYTFNFVQKIGINDSMIEFTKMVILLAFHDYPKNDYDKANFIMNKFKEKYGGIWSCGVMKGGDVCSEFFDYCILVKYGGYDIKIWKTSL